MPQVPLASAGIPYFLSTSVSFILVVMTKANILLNYSQDDREFIPV